MIIKLYDDKFTAGAKIFTSVDTGNGSVIIEHGPHKTQITVKLEASEYNILLYIYGIYLCICLRLYSTATGRELECLA